MSDDSGGPGIILVLLAIALTAHFLGYTQIASVAFWAAIVILGIVVALIFVLLVYALLFYGRVY